jgi:hypothetical protein
MIQLTNSGLGLQPHLAGCLSAVIKSPPLSGDHIGLELHGLDQLRRDVMAAADRRPDDLGLDLDAFSGLPRRLPGALASGVVRHQENDALRLGSNQIVDGAASYHARVSEDTEAHRAPWLPSKKASGTLGGHQEEISFLASSLSAIGRERVPPWMILTSPVRTISVAREMATAGGLVVALHHLYLHLLAADLAPPAALASSNAIWAASACWPSTEPAPVIEYKMPIFTVSAA